MNKNVNVKRGFIPFLALFLGFGALDASAQQVITVENAVKQALENNLQIKQIELQEALAEQDLLQSKMNFYPSLNASANGSLNWGLSFDQTAGRLVTQNVNSAGARLSSNVDLFQGFQKVNQVKANKYLLMANQSNVERSKNDLMLSVITTYLEALTNLDMYQASLQQMELSKEQLRVMNINVEAGNNTMADLSQAQTQLANDELNMTSAFNAYELSLLNLKQQMEMDPAMQIELVRPSVEAVQLSTNRMLADQIFADALGRFPEIKVAEYQTLAAERNVKIAQGALYPTLSLSAGIGTNYSSQARDFNTQQFLPFGDQLKRNRSESVGLSLSIPIFNQYRARIGINRAKINYKNAVTNEQLAKNNLNKVINQAVLDLRSAEKRLMSTEVALRSAKQTYEVIKLRFDEGMANAIELSTSQTAMNRAEFDHIQARYNLVFRSKVIDFYLGNPIRF